MRVPARTVGRRIRCLRRVDRGGRQTAEAKIFVSTIICEFSSRPCLKCFRLPCVCCLQAVCENTPGDRQEAVGGEEEREATVGLCSSREHGSCFPCVRHS